MALASVIPSLAQQAKPIALVPVEGVSISGGLNVINGQASIVNSGTVTAGDRTAHLALSRGGEVRLCSTTTLNLSKDSTTTDSNSTALMMSLDRGAMEATYVAGRYSDVLLTPDLRVFISGPGQVDLKIRVNAQGDTCVDNHGANGPYVTVSSLLEGGLYRVQANQRVLFEHGSLHDVVDHEQEPCGCPPAPIVSVASTGTGGGKAAAPGEVVGGPSSTPADTAFPLAQSEGLAPTPKVTDPSQAAQVHARVNVPLIYNGEAPPSPAVAQNVPRPIPSYDTEDPVVVADLKPAPTLPAPAGALLPHATPEPAPAPLPVVPQILPAAIASRPTNLATTSQPIGTTLAASTPGTVAPRMTIVRPPINLATSSAPVGATIPSAASATVAPMTTIVRAPIRLATNTPAVEATIPSAIQGTVAPVTTVVRVPIRMATASPGLSATLPSSAPATISPIGRSVQPLPARMPAPTPATAIRNSGLPPIPAPTPSRPKPTPRTTVGSATSAKPVATATAPASKPTARPEATATSVAQAVVAPAPKPPKPAQPERQPIPAVLHRIGHFFSRLFRD